MALSRPARVLGLRLLALMLCQVRADVLVVPRPTTRCDVWERRLEARRCPLTSRPPATGRPSSVLAAFALCAVCALSVDRALQHKLPCRPWTGHLCLPSSASAGWRAFPRAYPGAALPTAPRLSARKGDNTTHAAPNQARRTQPELSAPRGHFACMQAPPARAGVEPPACCRRGPPLAPAALPAARVSQRQLALPEPAALLLPKQRPPPCATRAPCAQQQKRRTRSPWRWRPRRPQLQGAAPRRCSVRARLSSRCIPGFHPEPTPRGTHTPRGCCCC